VCLILFVTVADIGEKVLPPQAEMVELKIVNQAKKQTNPATKSQPASNAATGLISYYAC
jgi:hypothetical protein